MNCFALLAAPVSGGRRLASLTVLSLGLALSAQATTIFSLTQDACTGTCGGGPYGTVQLDQLNATTVQVTLTLAPGLRFAGTNAGEALMFNVPSPISITGLPSGFVNHGPDTASAFGSFSQSIRCTACQGGQVGNPSGPLTFNVSKAGGLLESNFVANSRGYYFSSDIVGFNGNTGNVAANGLQDEPAVPEPFSMGLAGAGLLGLGLARRRFAK